MKRVLATILLSLALTSQAAIDTYQFADEAERERYRTLTEELRCPMCQNQNIADSNAPIAMDLRKEIFRMLGQGQSNEQIVDYLVARYGDFVRYKPPLKADTLLLWFGPALFLLIGFGVLLFVVLRKRRTATGAADQTLSQAERKRLASLLDNRNP
ncbi:cytochrome c-type biogenesis protein [Azomonas macrocytogenes]|uniref:Cytochrome c-type biogenesis protein n=1 Tax=Azomonas macrocytogenes TaxID=69962 RepID=A0A839SZU7_AZOMA|nr:cytochrome c-type biogenesis protein [Azomonas macrocytogenes]MBB3101800.1 cytochrome c-type biogenesis protein CcmH [Azomonas macrocytogenes]